MGNYNKGLVTANVNVNIMCIQADLPNSYHC